MKFYKINRNKNNFSDGDYTTMVRPKRYIQAKKVVNYFN